MILVRNLTHQSNYGDGMGGPGVNRGRLFIIWHGSGKYPTASAEDELRFLRRPDVRVSYHYYITKAGIVHQLVPDDYRAWHAGSSRWAEPGRSWRDLNDYSIGVAFESCNAIGEVYPPEQVASALTLARDLMAKFPAVTPARNLTHKEVSDPPGRKIDPVSFGIQSFRAKLEAPKESRIPLYSEDNRRLGEITLVDERKAYISDELRARLGKNSPG